MACPLDARGLSSFVGRADENQQLQQAAAGVGPAGQVIALVGTAGIGKSRMAHEFVGDLRQKEWQVLEADGNPLEQAVPFALFKKLLQSALAAGELSHGRGGRGPRSEARRMPISGRRRFRSCSTSP